MGSEMCIRDSIDIEGKKRLELNQSLEDEALIGMEWFVRGVINAD